MILHGILGALAILSFLLTLWQWLAARRFPLHQRSADLRSGAPSGGYPLNPPNQSPGRAAVTLLKPLKGCDEHTEACLRSWLRQDYAGEIQVLFGVAEASDPAGRVVNHLLAEFPRLDARLVLCPELLGANAKVSKLAQLELQAKHDLLVVSDADVLVPPDLLANVVLPLQSEQVGVVSCFYCLANPTTAAMRWEAIAINVDFWSQVRQSQSLQPLDFALGAVMALRSQQLAEIGGFRALVNYLADDYQLGHRLAKRGHRIELCPVVVECWAPPMNWSEVWRHQLRWARTIRVCRPMSYFFSIVANATLWPLIWLSANCGPRAALATIGFLTFRLLSAADLQQRLTQSRAAWPWIWLAPMKDLLQAALWFCAFTGNRVEWRGERYRVRRDGTLENRECPVRSDAPAENPHKHVAGRH